MAWLRRSPGRDWLWSGSGSFLPVRAWAARYYAKMMLFAECFGDRVIAIKCLWVAYTNLAVFACGLVQGRYAGDGRAAEGELWENAKALLEALNARLLRYWLYGPPPATVRMPGTDIPDLPGDPHMWWPLGGVLGAQPDTSRSVCLAKAARQASEHSRLLQDGWAGRQYEIQAVLHQVAEKNGVRFASPDVWPESPAVLFSLAARARLERMQGQAALELLEQALLCLDGKIDLSAEQLVVAAGAKRSHLFLMLLSEVGQALVMLDRPADALGIFVAVAAQFRRQGWAELTCHALRWVAKCAETTNDAEQCARAALELMVLDKAQCGRTAGGGGRAAGSSGECGDVPGVRAHHLPRPSARLPDRFPHIAPEIPGGLGLPRADRTTCS
ncbi:hypothetical protein DL89DRAFT_144168 [Linderina pennispora]|uniref:Uncharacterized protein n=1 Tax=Linderina pennispora TaxID=61395 RepID=A0A1Y1WBQ5_9FUNG|nr:uncharacterized protein DL89DRAFT_144168 [Linderina pennispora]ORX70967.1 hypothetical protein DL89DRAFT_144168 [Linderina pennispora]